MSALSSSPNLLLLSLLLGIVLVYLECNRPGLVVPGCLGCLLIVLAGHALASSPLTATGLLLSSGGVLTILIAISVPKPYIVSAAGAVMLASGLARLVRPGGASVHPVVALLVALGFAGSTVWLGRIAVIARRNKLARAGDRTAASGATG